MSSKYGSIPAEYLLEYFQNIFILKQCVNAFLPHLANSMNYFFEHSALPQELKLSEVTCLYKKLDPLQKKNRRPVSLLP